MDTAAPHIYTLSLHDALPICAARRRSSPARPGVHRPVSRRATGQGASPASPLQLDRKSTRLNSSHGYISYAVFCLKKKNKLPRTSRAGGGADIGVGIATGAGL